jgi:hypothetical protein
MFLLLRRENNFLAGLVCGCLIFKPQLGVAAAVVFVSIGAWRIVAGAAISAAATTFGRVSSTTALNHCGAMAQHAAERERHFAPARTQALSDSLVADFLVDAVAVAASGACALCS